MTFSRDRFLLIYIGTQASIDDCLYVSLYIYIYEINASPNLQWYAYLWLLGVASLLSLTMLASRN